MTRTGSLLALALMGGICVKALSTAQAANVVNLAADLKQAVASWALDAPSGAPVRILDTNGRYTLHPSDRATPDDRRWASQVRGSMILAQQAGVDIDVPVTVQASFGVWMIRFEGGLSVVASSASEAISYFLSILFERAPTKDLHNITCALIDHADAVPRVASGTTATMPIFPHIVFGESTDPRITISIAPHTEFAQVNATPDVAPGYYQLFFYDSESRFSPAASTVIKVVSTGFEH